MPILFGFSSLYPPSVPVKTALLSPDLAVAAEPQMIAKARVSEVHRPGPHHARQD